MCSQILKISSFLILFGVVYCAGPEKEEVSKSEKPEKAEKSDGPPTADNYQERKVDKQSKVDTKEAPRKEHIYSLANNSMTSFTYNLTKANKLVNKYSLEANSISELENRLAAQRYARSDAISAWSTLSRIALLYAKKDYDADIPGLVRLEMALTAIASKDFDMAEYFLADLIEVKNKVIQAAAYNASGLIALKENRIPEAVSDWEQALKIQSSFKPAMLNLGFIALKYGDFNKAKRYLGGISADWYVQSGLLVADRHTNSKSAAASKCDRLLSSHKKHQVITFNCGLFYMQEEKQFKRAKKLLTDSASINKGPPNWSEQAYQLIGRIEDMQMQAMIKKEEAAAKKSQTKKGK